MLDKKVQEWKEQEKETIHSYLQKLDSEEPEVYHSEVTEVIMQEMAAERTLTGEILNSLAIKELQLVPEALQMGETQMMMMMETVEMIMTKMMMPQT